MLFRTSFTEPGNGRVISVVIADTAQEVAEHILPRLRPEAREYYEKDIVQQLSTKGKSIVDSRSGKGKMYRLSLWTKHTREKGYAEQDYSK